MKNIPTISGILKKMGVDFGMLKLLDIPIIKGRDLTEKISSDTISNVLLNETAAKTLLEKAP
jgi:putative ABC transport system permease protein